MADRNSAALDVRRHAHTRPKNPGRKLAGAFRAGVGVTSHVEWHGPPSISGRELEGGLVLGALEGPR